MVQYMLLLLGLLPAGWLSGQTNPEKAGRIDQGKFVLTIDLSWNEDQREELTELFDLDSLMTEKIFRKNLTYINDSTEWSATLIKDGILEISKEITKPSDTWFSNIILSEVAMDKKTAISTPDTPPYGVNQLTRPENFRYLEGEACFLLHGYPDAQKVYLSGSFNQWSTMQLPMQRTGLGWTACISLPPGKHLYKFIVDGRWMTDPDNKLKERDGQRGQNSVIFCYNHTFRLEGFKDSRQVILTGSFNDWNNRELQMKKDATGWVVPLFLREGTHAYKYIVDGKWITDPGNPVERPDGRGNVNSFIGIGDTLIFRLRGYPDATRVILSGSFNAWNTGELIMNKVDDEWQLPYVLAAGNYEYKFIVDGKWITDPVNPFTTGSGNFTNSFLAFKPNHLFVLSGFTETNNIIVTGTFNGWSRNDYRMVLRVDEWVFPIHLKPGRYSYKFITDGEWILDPANLLWEENEFGTGNSVLWIE
ncbi:MAG: glycogen-binding domain-containing protein [Bacteroidales bacterium]